MSTFKFSKLLCEKWDAIIRNIWWNLGSIKDKSKPRFIAYKNWNHICVPKDVGGLSVYKFEDINSSLMYKLGWHHLNNYIRWSVQLFQKKNMVLQKIFLLWN